MGKKSLRQQGYRQQLLQPCSSAPVCARSYLSKVKQTEARRLFVFNEAEEGKTLACALGEESYTMLQSLIRPSQLTVEVMGNS